MPAKKLLTRAEATRYRETSRSEDVTGYFRALASRTDKVRLEFFGKSAEGRDLMAAIVSDRGAFTPEEARRQKKIVVMVQGNIHAGEVEGKDAIQALVRDLTLGNGDREILPKVCAVFVPNVNPDGNDRIHPDHRRLDLEHLEGQVNPEGGVGTRYTGEGWNMNRDFIKQDAVETRLAAKLFQRWWPHLFVDCHTTDGSIHRHDLTFDTFHSNQELFGKLLGEARSMLEGVAKRIRKSRGFSASWYGNWSVADDPNTAWQTYPALPRFGSHYRGLLGRLDLLLETYSYIDFKRRVEVVYAWLDEILRHAARNRTALVRAVEREERRILERGIACDPRPVVGIDYGVARRDAEGKLAISYPAHAIGGETIGIESYDEESVRAHRFPGRRKTVYEAPHRRTFVPTASVSVPRGYLVPAGLATRLENHGIAYDLLAEETTLEVESYRVLAIEKTSSPDVAAAVPPPGAAEVPLSRRPPPVRFESVLSVRPERHRGTFPAGTLVVKTAQRAGTLAIYLLEPHSDDGFARWEFLDHALKVGELFPIARIH